MADATLNHRQFQDVIIHQSRISRTLLLPIVQFKRRVRASAMGWQTE